MTPHKNSSYCTQEKIPFIYMPEALSKTCNQCSETFTITAQEQDFFQKIAPTFGDERFDIPLPTSCPRCRRKRRHAFRNERNLYQRKCDLCLKDIVSIYHEKKTFPVYCPDCWWSDKWDPMSYGRNFDFSRTFFEQFAELFHEVPKLALIKANDENSEYNNSVGGLKNCYLTFDGGMSQDCYYGQTFDTIRDCVDFLSLQDSELCYECNDCKNCYHLFYSQFSQNCRDSYFLRDCIGCKNCFGCTNLRQKEYCIFNEQFSKEEYEKRIAAFDLASFANLKKVTDQVRKFWQSQSYPAVRGIGNENSTGNNINHCSNAILCFNCKDLQDCGYCTIVIVNGKDCYDLDKWGRDTELVYNSASSGDGAHNIIAGYYCAFGASNMCHSAYCWQNCHDLFGCVGFHNKNSFSILNKQYSKEEYMKLVPQIIRHMQKTNEWTQFFPPSLSAFGYNESVAQEEFPLTKEEALAQNWQRDDYVAPDPPHSDVLEQASLPDRIKDVDESILKKALRCESSGKLYRIVAPELAFYRRFDIPLPRRHPDIRHLDRRVLSTVQQLFESTCSKCGTALQTVYPSSEKKLVYCAKHYEEAVA